MTRRTKAKAPKVVETKEALPTPAEVDAILGRTRFTGGEVDFPIDKAKGALDDIAEEIRSVADRVSHEIHDIDHHGHEGARLRADALGAFARTLSDLSVRMLRHAGQLEGFAECIDSAERGAATVESIREGKLTGWRGLLGAGGAQ